MAKSNIDIVRELVIYIEENGAEFSSWYVGIAVDPEDRLFNNHKVIKHPGAWIYRECTSSNDARKIEQYFLDHYKTQGGPGGGDNDTKYVYAYKIGNHTIEKA